MRSGNVMRETKETKIDLTIDLDGSGRADVESGIGFFNHMLTLLAAHGRFDLVILRWMAIILWRISALPWDRLCIRHWGTRRALPVMAPFSCPWMRPW